MSKKINSLVQSFYYAVTRSWDRCETFRCEIFFWSVLYSSSEGLLCRILSNLTAPWIFLKDFLTCFFYLLNFGPSLAAFGFRCVEYKLIAKFYWLNDFINSMTQKITILHFLASYHSLFLFIRFFLDEFQI